MIEGRISFEQMQFYESIFINSKKHQAYLIIKKEIEYRMFYKKKFETKHFIELM